MPLTDTAIRNAKGQEKSIKLTDGAGLYLLVNPNDSKWWRFDYRYQNKRKTISFGTYPETGLKEARDKRGEARKLVASGIDPGEQRKAAKSAQYSSASNSFEHVAREWFGKQSKVWAPSHSDKIMLRMEKDLFPWLGNRPVSEITAAEFLSCLRRVESRGAVESSHRILQNCGQIMRYAIATGRAARNPAADLRGALEPVQAKPRAAIIEPSAIGQLLRAIDSYQGSFVTKCALKFAPLTFVRPGELRQAEWREFDLANALWTIPASRMKMKEPHSVPLSTQALSVLSDLEPLTGRGQYVFPGARSPKRPMSNNAILAALRRMGFGKDEMSGHGFRAMARTILDEVLNIRPDFIEHQLAHAVRDPNGRAYNRTTHFDERRKMMQIWSDYLENLKLSTD
jgi:integrase